jgi:Biotin carboxyl carrier protein
MTKIDKTDIENIKLISKEAKIQKINKVKIKKGNYEIEISSINNLPDLNQRHLKENKNEVISAKSDKEIVNDENIVKSPMVGVAYLSADPNTKPYVKIGQHVKQGDTLLLIEAMKTFNEIKAPKSGVIKKIVILNSQPVEFGDNLIIFE